MSLLTMVQRAAARQSGLRRPAAIVSSTDLTVLQLLELANEEGELLAKRFDWQVLTKEASFTTVATESQGLVSTIASDFDRPVTQTEWNQDQQDILSGPVRGTLWQRLKIIGNVSSTTKFRIRGGEFLLNPVPAAGETVTFEYISNAWCQSASGTPQTEWLADTDTGILPEFTMRLGLIWRWRESKGLDYAETFRTYENQVLNDIDSDGGHPVIDMGGPHDRTPSARAPLGNWPL